jgi:hypothetical protein
VLSAVFIVSIVLAPLAAPRGGASGYLQLAITVPAAAFGIFWLRRVGAAYKQTCLGAYYGTLDKVAKSKRLGTLRISTCPPVPPPEWLRIKDARRWARWLTFAAASYTLVMACSVCVSVLVAFWNAGLITTVRPWTAAELPVRVFGQVVWTLADSIPVLDLPSSLHWTDPAPFHQSPIVDIALLIARVVVFGPLIAWLVSVCRRSDFDPRDSICADPVVNRVVIGLCDFDRWEVPANRIDPQLSLTATDRWDYALTLASKQLGAGWVPGRVREHIAGVPPKSIW